MPERYSACAGRTLQRAVQQAVRWNHEYIGTEHILLGLIEDDLGPAVRVLASLQIDRDHIRADLEHVIRAGPDIVLAPKLPRTPRAKQALQFAADEAEKFHRNEISSEHLLLGLLREHDGVAAKVLINRGLTLKETRKAAAGLLKLGED